MKAAYSYMPLSKSSGEYLEPERYVDLRSDTFTTPTAAMRNAMAEAEVGDDVVGEDPTINALQEKVAKLLDKEAAIFLTSGTMGNLIAILSHCEKRGDKALIGDKSHILLHEDGGASMLGVPIHTIPFEPNGTFDLDEMEEKVQSLFCIENTYNGCVLPLEFIDEVGLRLSRKGVPLHMDGARLLNAAVFLGVPASRIVRGCSSVTFCFSKGLGAPVGSMLVGSRDFIKRAHRWRHLLGGAMRQVGVLGAPCEVALETGVARLADDHRRMFKIATAIAAMKSTCVTVDLHLVQTNMAFLEINPKFVTAREFLERIGKVTVGEKSALGKSIGIKCYDLGSHVVRFVTYNAITDTDVDDVCRKMQYVISCMDEKLHTSVDVSERNVPSSG